MRALVDLLAALRGTVTVALRRIHPAALIGAGLVAVALVAGAIHVTGGGDSGGPPGGYELGAPARDPASGAAADEGRPAGDPLVNILGTQPTDPRPPGGPAAHADDAGGARPDAAGAAPPASAPNGDEPGGSPPGTGGTPTSTAPGQPSFGSSRPPSTTTTEPTTDAGDGGGVLSGLLSLLGLS